MMKGKFIDKNKQTKSSVSPAFEKSEEKIIRADFISPKKENLADEIEPELRDIAKALEQMDFSEISHKEQIKNKVLENLEDRKRIKMKKSNIFNRRGLVSKKKRSRKASLTGTKVWCKLDKKTKKCSIEGSPWI